MRNTHTHHKACVCRFCKPLRTNVSTNNSFDSSIMPLLGVLTAVFLAKDPTAYSTNFQDRARVLQEWTPQEV